MSTGPDRVAAIQHEVQNRVFELPVVALDPKRRFRLDDLQPDRGVERRARQFRDIRHQGRHIVRPGRSRLAAREGQHPPGQIGAAPDRVARRVEIAVPGLRHVVAGKLYSVFDGAQQVVEVMRDPAGQLPKCVEPRRALGLLPVALELAHIVQQHDRLHILGGPRGDRRAGHLEIARHLAIPDDDERIADRLAPCSADEGVRGPGQGFHVVHAACRDQVGPVGTGPEHLRRKDRPRPCVVGNDGAALVQSQNTALRRFQNRVQTRVQRRDPTGVARLGPLRRHEGQGDQKVAKEERPDQGHDERRDAQPVAVEFRAQGGVELQLDVDQIGHRVLIRQAHRRVDHAGRGPAGVKPVDLVQHGVILGQRRPQIFALDRDSDLCAQFVQSVEQLHRRLIVGPRRFAVAPDIRTQNVVLEIVDEAAVADGPLQPADDPRHFAGDQFHVGFGIENGAVKRDGPDGEDQDDQNRDRAGPDLAAGRQHRAGRTPPCH